MDIIYGHICIMFLMCDVVIINNEKSLKTTLAFVANTSQKMKFSIKDFFSKCNQICRKLRIWSHLLKKSLMKTSFFVQCKLGAVAPF